LTAPHFVKSYLRSEHPSLIFVSHAREAHGAWGQFIDLKIRSAPVVRMVQRRRNELLCATAFGGKRGPSSVTLWVVLVVGRLQPPSEKKDVENGGDSKGEVTQPCMKACGLATPRGPPFVDQSGTAVASPPSPMYFTTGSAFFVYGYVRSL